MDALELVQATSKKINDIGAAFYFDPATLAWGKERGLDGFRLYILGRGGLMGDAPASVVSAAFGYFEPALIDKMWNSAKAICPPVEAAAGYLAANAELGRRRLANVAGLDGFNDAAEAIVAHTDPAGLSLYSGLVSFPLPDDAPGRAMHLSVVLRELRGSVHLNAVVASGLSPIKAHALARPDDVGAFGHAVSPEITELDRERYGAAHALTDDMMVPAFAALTDDQGAALLAGTNAIHRAVVESE